MPKTWPDRMVNLPARFFLLLVLLTVFALYGAKDLAFVTEYRIFFDEKDPQLVNHDAIQARYLKADNIIFLVAPDNGDIFTQANLSLLQRLTEQAWTLPHAVRIDSLTNFQEIRHQADDIEIGDLLPNPIPQQPHELQSLRDKALKEPELRDLLISSRGHVAAVSVRLSLPDGRLEANRATHEAVNAAEAIRDALRAEHPDVTVQLVGQTVVNHSFDAMAKQDMFTLVPLMIALIGAVLYFLIRCLRSVGVILAIVGYSVVLTMGLGGWLGIQLNQATVVAPLIIMTLGLCDCIHILSNYFGALAAGQSKTESMRASLSLNIRPVLLTSITTAIGFLSLQFSESPPFRELGVLSALGVMVACGLSLTLFPFIICRINTAPDALGADVRAQRLCLFLCDQLLKHRNRAFVVLVALTSLMVLGLPRNELNDNTVGYFSPRTEMRQAADYMQEHLTGFDLLSFSFENSGTYGVHEPEFLRQVDAFVTWLRAQPEVAHVSSYTETLKALHTAFLDDPQAYRIPDDPELTAQLGLSYELSLPFGQTLTHHVDLAKKGLLVTARLRHTKAKQILAIEQRAYDWLSVHAPAIAVHGESASKMFAEIGLRNIYSMIDGALLALVLISITMAAALKSVKLGLLSLLPNAAPAAAAMGLWGYFVGEVNLAVAFIFTVTLGIIVDDTLHFLNKYLHAKSQLQYSAEDAVRYAFQHVGPAIVVTTIILTLGFLVLALSPFNVNAHIGALISITLVIALAFDLTVLPVLLLLLDRRRRPVTEAESNSAT